MNEEIIHDILWSVLCTELLLTYLYVIDCYYVICSAISVLVILFYNMIHINNLDTCLHLLIILYISCVVLIYNIKLYRIPIIILNIIDFLEVTVFWYYKKIFCFYKI